MLDSLLQLPGGLDVPTSGAQSAGDALVKEIGASEWLGPLAPVALSPFFGIAILSGLATYGPDFLQQRSHLIADSSPLNNPYLFWSMATLALLTSLPRLSKVSKPLALAAESLESYASIIILIAVKFLSSAPAVSSEPEVALAGLGVISLDTMMSVAAALNIVVINTVKLFFELMVWLIPFPAVDAALEVCQKGTCLGLMGLYCYSPVLATMLNLCLLSLCALVFGWVVRKTAYYRHLIITPVLAWLLPNWFGNRDGQFTAYSLHRIGRLPAYTAFTIREVSPTEFEVRGAWMWSTHVYHFQRASVERVAGLLADELRLRDEACQLSFSHRRI